MDLGILVRQIFGMYISNAVVPCDVRSGYTC